MALFMIAAVSAPDGSLRIIVTGSRNWTNYPAVCATLDSLDVASLDHGDCPGADRFADRWAKLRDVPHHAHPADWGRLGRRAGPLRNIEMFTNVHPDAVVAFKDAFGLNPHGGTEHMVGLAEAAGTPVLLVGDGRTRWL